MKGGVKIKHYKVNTKDIVVIGNCPYFKGDLFEYSKSGCDMFGTFKGMDVSNSLRGHFDTKEKAIQSAKENHSYNKPFCDGTVPFEIIFKTSNGWQVMTGNLNSNNNMIKNIYKNRKPLWEDAKVYE